MQLSLYKKYKEFFAKKMPEAEAKKKAYEYMRKKMGQPADNPFTEASEGGTKSVPNPNGKKGGAAHQNIINCIEKTNSNGRMQYERRYATPGGYKKSRYANVVEIVDGEVTKIYQVGKCNKNGTPIIRESKAIDDIMNSPDYNGVPVYFGPYNNPQMGPIIFEY